VNVIDAFNSVQARVLEHTHEGQGAGLTLVLEQLGVDPDDMEAAIPSVLYEHDINRIPVSAGLVAAFAAGASYTRANHSSVESVPLTSAGIVAAGDAVNAYGNDRDWQKMRPDEIVSIVVSALRGPVADPPTDDGAGASS
jgi:hypothetical protein